MCNNPCQSCGNCVCNCDEGLGCLDTVYTTCIIYKGPSLDALNINTDTYINDLISSVNTNIKYLKDNIGKVKIDASDTCMGALIDKIEPGANIIVSGVGSGCNKKLRIDAILGGTLIDEKVKVSPTDQLPSYLQDKLIAGDCVIIQKVNQGLNEALKIVIDWNCVLAKLVNLPGYCTTITNCTGGPLQPCPGISLNSPIINGPNVSFNWTSVATQYNVYIDGILEPGMPISAHTYTKNGFIDGAHFVQVAALCQNGAPNLATSTFVINTSCPSASNVVVTLVGGNAALTWNAPIGVNVTGQLAQYRAKGASTWISSSTLSSSASSYTFTGLIVNEVYEFQIITNCSAGGPTVSPTVNNIELNCPNMTLTPSNTSIQYQFSSQAGDINKYVIELLNNTGTVVLASIVENQPFASNIVNTFIGLTNGTAYQVRLTIYADNNNFTKICNVQSISTTTPPACPEPTGMTITVS